MRRLVSCATALICAAPFAAAFAQVPGNDHSFEIGASPDGRYVVFTSNATNLVSNDTNGAPDVFLFDRQTTSVTRVSTDANGLQGNNLSEHPSVSANGLLVAFDSSVENFDGVGGPFLKDLGTGAIERLDTARRSFPSLSDDGNVVMWDRGNQLRLVLRDPPFVIDVTSPPGGATDFLDWGPVVSGNGDFVAFATKRQFAGINDTNGQADVYRYIVSDGFYQLASVGPTENGANGPSGGIDVSTSYKRIAISDSGSRVAFYSEATNLTATPFGGVFVRDFGSGTTRHVVACNPCGESFYAISISADGNWLAFYAIGAFLELPSMTPRSEGYYLYDYAGMSLKRLAGNVPGTVTVGQAFAATAVANNGTQVALQTNETFAGIPDRAPFADIFLLPQPTGNATLASRAALGAIDEGQSRMPALSGDGKHVAFASFASNLGPADINDVRDVYVRTIGTGVTKLASTTVGGTQGNGESRNPALSEDGRYVVFISDASNLTPDDDPGNLADVFVKDLSNGAIERVSRSPVGVGGGVFLASAPALSGDLPARFVAFTSGADFVADGVFGVDAYIRDRAGAGSIVRASPTFDGSDPDIACNVCGHSLSLSDDGQFLAFQALSNNMLATQDVDDAFDVFVFDRISGAVELVSRNSGPTGAEADCDNLGPTISGDGRYVGFWSCATNLPGATGSGAIYVRDRTANTTSRVASSPRIVDFLGAEPGPVFSRDGAVLAFVSFARDLVAGDTNALPDAFVFERSTGRITRASLSAAFNQANGASYTYDLVESIPRFYGLSLDRDGDRLALAAAATNLTGDDRNAADDVFVFDRATQAVERASAPPNPPSASDLLAPAVSSDGRYAVALRTDRQGALGGGVGGKRGKGLGDKFGSIVRYDWTTQAEVAVDVGSTELPANGNSKLPAISPTGALISFASEADNLSATADTNGATDVFLRDLDAGTTIAITQGANADSGQSAVTMLGDKYRVAVETLATNLVPNDTNGVPDIVVATEDATNTLASVSSGGASSNGASTQPSISADGRFVGFTSLGTNLVSGDDNNAADVFLRDLTGPTTTLVSVAFNGAKPNGASGAAQIVATGAGPDDWVASFESEASNVVFGDTNFETDIFVRTGDQSNELVSIGFDGAPANGKSFSPSLSPDGRYVSFTSTASNLVAGDDNDAPDVFLYDRIGATTTLVSVSTAGVQANDFPLRPAVGFDNGEPVVVWDTPADNLGTVDTNQAFDLYRRRVVSGVTQSNVRPVLFADSFE